MSVLMIIFLLLFRHYLILETSALDTVGKARRSPVAVIAVFYRLIKQQIHNHLLASLGKKKNKAKKDQTNPPLKKEKQSSQKTKTLTPNNTVIA